MVVKYFFSVKFTQLYKRARVVSIRIEGTSKSAADLSNLRVLARQERIQVHQMLCHSETKHIDNLLVVEVNFHNGKC